MTKIKKFISIILIMVIWIYKKLISPWLPVACRYQPTCSEYMIEAIHRYGAWHGVVLGIKRICRCHPWGGHGYDPVPKQDELHKNDAV